MAHHQLVCLMRVSLVWKVLPLFYIAWVPIRIEIVLVEAVVLEAVHLMKWLLVVVVKVQQWKQF